MTDLVLAEEPSAGELLAGLPPQRPWKILVVDDDEEIHALTRLVLRHFSFERRSVELIGGYTGREAVRLMADHRDVAVILMDVVMESEHAGLEAVRRIREELENRFVRIIMRTGQPGQAPEHRVIQDYDINDYKEKVRLTTQRLITSVTAALRSYRDLRAIDNTRRGLARIVQATGDLFEARSLGRLAQGILRQSSHLLEVDTTVDHRPAAGFAAIREEGGFLIYSAMGGFSDTIGRSPREVLGPDWHAQLETVIGRGGEAFHPTGFLACYRTRTGMENLICLQASRLLEDLDRDLLATFSSNIAMAFENLGLNREIVNTQKDVTFTLGEVIEIRSNEAGNHVRRVAESSRLLATLLGLSQDDVELLWLASPLHDLGKIGIPDHILNKPGRLTPEEWGIMRTHPEIGRQILKGSERPILRTGAIIAHQHHEKWNGTGYPRGLRDRDIHVFARITALIDVFDALLHKRCYKDAWPLERILTLIREERGQHFDPDMVDAFLDNLQDFTEIQEAFRE
ncbi:MAG: DUF3369 domain-containing protein [Magnetococcales bacterium]|nr:DUF3369 domain-containing protein [Magnetococcales bacterium]